MKLAYWDIECWDLNAPFGPILCVSILDVASGEMVTLRQDEYVEWGWAESMRDDKELCIAARDMLDEMHMHAGWFSKGFDIKHLNSRLALHGERLLQRKLHMDAIWYFKGWRGLDFGSAKMKNVAKHLGLEQKPDVEADTWLAAREGDKEAFDEVVDRCEADVRITRQLTEYALSNGLMKNITSYP